MCVHPYVYMNDSQWSWCEGKSWGQWCRCLTLDEFSLTVSWLSLASCQPAGIIRCLDRKEHCFKTQSYTLQHKAEWHPLCVLCCVVLCCVVCVCVCVCVCVFLLWFSYIVIARTSIVTLAEPGRSYTQTLVRIEKELGCFIVGEMETQRVASWFFLWHH